MSGNRRTPSRGQGPRANTRPGRSGSARPATRRTPAPAAPERARFTSRAAILILVLAVLTVSYASSMRAYLEQKAHLESLRASIASSQQNIADLRREQRRWDDKAYVEAQARQRFGFVMPGETSFQVIGRDGEPLNPDDTLTDPTAELVDQPVPWWESAWGTMEAAGDPESNVPTPVDEIDVPRKKKSGQ